jgi:hypothetical protein
VTPLPHAKCPVCGGDFAVRNNGTMREHQGMEVTSSGRVPKCGGSGKRPRATFTTGTGDGAARMVPS